MVKNPKIPANYQSVMPYLIIKNAAGFITFMKDVFGAEVTGNFMRQDNLIMHAELLIGGSTIMLADSTEKFNEKSAGLFIYVEDADETFKKAIDSSCTIISKLADQPYGRSGGVEDPFGNIWWITSIAQT